MFKKIFAVFMLWVSFVQPVFAISNQLTKEIDNNVQEYIDAVFSASGSDIFLLVSAIATFLFFMVIVGEIIKFIMGNADWVAAFTAVILFIATLAFIASYGPFTYVIKGAFEDLGNVFQFLIVGSKDKMFLSDFIDRTITQAVQAPDVGFTDTIWMWAVTIIWAVVSLFLQIAFYLADVFVTLGYSLARMVGVLFIPFLIAPWTRKIFDGWVRFYIGWGVCSILLRLTSLLSMLVMKATINAAGKFENPASMMIDGNFNVTAPLVITDENLSLLWAIIVFGIISCIMIFSSFGFAKMLCSGVGSASNGATNMAKSAAVKAVTVIL
ncbi:type IV secretion system protein [Pantoea agglomerans]|uniref:type IV secretion system protein n=1 Tax=Enterobacter agglomerans TaxID=549 RepID=UPI00320B0824